MAKIKILKNKLIELYHKKKMSPYKIGVLLGCSFSTITNRLKEYKISRRTKSEAQNRYPKYDFSGNKIEKAYLIGFRIGDLNVYRPSEKSQILVVRCHTTQAVQTELIRKLLSKYGQITCSDREVGKNVNCYLNNSFLFLLPKYDNVENWIKKDSQCAAAFIAGYVDAEANFILNQGRARFKIDTYDKNILEWMHAWCEYNKINSKFRLLTKKGERWGINFKKDLWRLNINEACSLMIFIEFIYPYLKHKTRIKQVNLMKRNILARINRGTI